MRKVHAVLVNMIQMWTYPTQRTREHSKFGCIDNLFIADANK